MSGYRTTFGVTLRRGSRMRAAWRLARSLGPAGMLGIVCVAIVCLMAIGAPVIAPGDASQTNVEAILQPPGPGSLFGTDVLGRDVFARVVWGARISLLVSLSAVVLGHGLGAAVGLVSAYLGASVDLTTQRLMDAVQSFPLLILAVAIVAFLGSSVWNVILALALVIIPSSQRVVRSAALVIKSQQYVEAARVVGCRGTRIVFVHMLPNAMAPIMVIASASLGTAVLVEASLSFLGLGPPPPTPTWGGMLSAAAAQFMEVAPWTAIFPGIAISVTVLGFNLVGDALRDLWDPRLRGR